MVQFGDETKWEIMKHSASNMTFLVVEHGSEHYESSVALRDRILRKPLGLQFTPEQLAAEASSCHVVGVLDGAIRACCILVDHGEGAFQARQVAVDDGLQRQGFGEQLMLFAEQQIRTLGGHTAFCHARAAAAEFYRKLGYEVSGEEFEEVGITHVCMKKQL